MSGADRLELGWGRLWVSSQKQRLWGLGGYKTPVCYRGGLALFHPSLLPLRGEKAESFAFQGTVDFSLP